MRITAFYKDDEGDQVNTEQQVVAFYSVGDFHVDVATSTDEGLLGEHAIFHLRSNFRFQDFSYVVSLLLHSQNYSRNRI